jgi:hypothetical protein
VSEDLNVEIRKREAIVDRHMRELLDELRKEGFDALGVAGGVVIGTSTDDQASLCHTFLLLLSGVLVDDQPVNPDTFVAEVARNLIEGLSSRLHLPSGQA